MQLFSLILLLVTFGVSMTSQAQIVFDINQSANMCTLEDTFLYDSCFSNRIVINSSSDEEVKFISQNTAIQNDLNEVCGCLKKNAVVKEEMKDEKAKLEIYFAQSNLNTMKARIEALRNVSVVQNRFLGGNVFFHTSDFLDSIYGPPEEIIGKLNKASSFVEQNFKKNLPSNIQVTQKQEMELDGLIKKISFDDLNTAKDQFSKEEGSCLPMDSFFEMTQVPAEKEFWKELSDAKEFIQENWDYRKLNIKLTNLIKKYNEENLDKENIRAEIRGIKGKLKFLYRNPTYKYAFASKKKWFGKDHKIEQKKLFDTLKGNLLRASSTCWKNDHACADEFFNSENSFRFKHETVKTSAMNEELLKMVRVGTADDFEEEIENLKDTKNWFDKSLPADQRSISQKVFNGTGFDINKCGQGVPDTYGECISGFKTYCSMLSNLNPKEPLDRPASFEDEWINEMSFDSEKNQRYQELNKTICYGQRKSEPNSDTSINFTSYYASKCSNEKMTPQNIPNECKDENRHQLLASFMREYPYSGNSGLKTYASLARLEDNLITDPNDIEQVKLVKERAKIEESLSQMKTAHNITGNRKLSLKEALSLVREAGRNISRSFAEAGVGKLDNPGNAENAVNTGPGFGEIMRELNKTMSNANRPKENENDFSNFNFNESPIPNNFNTQSARSNEKDEAISEARRLRDDALRERSKIQDELEASKRAVAENNQNAAMNNLQERIKMLEGLLAQKDQSAKQYENTLSRLLGEKEKENERDNSRVANNQISERIRNENSSNELDQFEQFNQMGNRAPASVNDRPVNGSGAGLSSAGGAALINSTKGSSSSAMGQRSLNQALLSKYGITVQGSTDNSILVAMEKESTGLSILNTASEKNVPLEVPRTQYERFKTNDLAILNEIYNAQIKTFSESVVKIQVTTQGEKESLEFYAIREGGKVIFQPVRKAKLKNLQLSLPSL